MTCYIKGHCFLDTYFAKVMRPINSNLFTGMTRHSGIFNGRTQEQAEEEVGSWDPALFAGETDRLQVTARAILCLQLPYRYLPLYRSEK